MILLGVIGPYAPPISAHNSVKACSVTALNFAGDGLFNLLDRRISPFTEIPNEILRAGEALTPDNMLRQHMQKNQQIAQLFSESVRAFHMEFEHCLHSYGELDSEFHVATVLRVCEPFSSHACEGRSNTKPSNLSYSRFQKVYEWMKTQGYPIANVWQQLAPEGTRLAEVSPPAELYLWPELPNQQLVLNQFENGVLRHRSHATKFDYPVPHLIGLNRTSALHVTDVLNSPARAIADLQVSSIGSVPHVEFPQIDILGEQHAVFRVIPHHITEDLQLSIVSDEVARSRIVECSSYRGMHDPAAISQCSGYKLTDASLMACLDGERCLPDFDQKALAAVLAINSPRSEREMLSAAAIPRIPLSGTFGDLTAIGKACYDKHHTDKNGTTLCLLESATSGRPENRVLTCLRQAREKNSATVDCLSALLPDERARQQAKCISDAGKNPREAVWCAASTSIGEDARRAVNCMREYQQTEDATQAALCYSKGEHNSDERIAAQCVLEHRKRPYDAAICIAEKKGGIPPAAKSALSCAQTQGSDVKKFAGCMVANNIPELPGDLGRFAKCYVMNEGSGLATAGCMLADNLTPEQQIGLQCASQSSDVASFALCTGGQLTAREYVKCQNERIGHGECFGKNNEIRKFVNNISGQDINDATLLGQAMELHLEVAKVEVAFAETAGKTLEDLANGAGRVGQQLADGADHISREVNKQAEQAREKACGVVVCVVGIPTSLPNIPLPHSDPITRTSNGTCVPWCF